MRFVAFLDPDDMSESFPRLFSENNSQSGQQARAMTSSEYECLRRDTEYYGKLTEI